MEDFEKNNEVRVLQARLDQALRTGAPDDVISGLMAQIERARLGDEPVTVEGDVLPIKANLGTSHQEPSDNVLANAIAGHFGIETEQLTGFVAAVEYTRDEGVTLSSVWSLGVPAWRLRAFATELLKHLDKIGE